MGPSSFWLRSFIGHSFMVLVIQLERHASCSWERHRSQKPLLLIFITTCFLQLLKMIILPNSPEYIATQRVLMHLQQTYCHKKFKDYKRTKMWCRCFQAKCKNFIPQDHGIS